MGVDGRWGVLLHAVCSVGVCGAMGRGDWVTGIGGAGVVGRGFVRVMMRSESSRSSSVGRMSWRKKTVGHDILGVGQVPIGVRQVVALRDLILRSLVMVWRVGGLWWSSGVAVFYR